MIFGRYDDRGDQPRPAPIAAVEGHAADRPPRPLYPDTSRS
jgi:hypothetical protein